MDNLKANTVKWSKAIHDSILHTIGVGTSLPKKTFLMLTTMSKIQYSTFPLTHPLLTHNHHTCTKEKIPIPLQKEKSRKNMPLGSNTQTLPPMPQGMCTHMTRRNQSGNVRTRVNLVDEPGSSVCTRESERSFLDKNGFLAKEDTLSTEVLSYKLLHWHTVHLKKCYGKVCEQ